jgi:hypothetical protein
VANLVTHILDMRSRVTRSGFETQSDQMADDTVRHGTVTGMASTVRCGVP